MKTVWSIEIDAPRERVWRALTAPGEIQPFYYGSRFEGDLRPGGAFRYATPDGSRTFIRGTVVEVLPNERFVHTFRFTDLAEPEQRVSVELEDVARGTRVTIRHEGLDAAPKHRRRVAGGWARILGNLKAWVEQGSLPASARLQNLVMKAFLPLLPAEVPAAADAAERRTGDR